MKRAITTLSWPLNNSNIDIIVQKKAINVCTQLYPVILKWASLHKSDKEVETCWNIFTHLKNCIIEKLESDNEGFLFKIFILIKHFFYYFYFFFKN